MSVGTVVLAVVAMLCATCAFVASSVAWSFVAEEREETKRQVNAFAEAKRRDDLKRADQVYADAVKRQKALARQALASQPKPTPSGQRSRGKRGPSA